MVPKEIVRLHNLHIRNLSRLQNFTRAFRAGDIRACPHFAPFTERARDPNLGPNPNDQWDAYVKQPIRSKTETVWIHTEPNLTYEPQLSLYWLEQIRRAIPRFVHFGRHIALRFLVDAIYLLCLRLATRVWSQSSKSSSRQSGFARKRRPQSAIFLCGAAAFWLIQAATSASFAPVAINSRKASASSPQAAKNFRSIGQL